MNIWFNSNVYAVRDIAKHLKEKWEYIPDALKIEDPLQRVDVLIWNQNKIIQKVLETAKDYNKWKEKPLRKFLNNYIVHLSLLDDSELLSKIHYYLALYEELNTSGWSDVLDQEISESPHIYSKTDILSELLISNTYLPDYQKQSQFDEEMLHLIKRLENRVEKFMMYNNPVLFSVIEPYSLLNYMDDTNWYSLRGIKHIDKWLVHKIWYYFSLARMVDIKKQNEFYINWVIDTGADFWITKNDFISYLRENIKAQEIIVNKEYHYKQDSLFKYTVYIWENFNIWDLEYDENGFSDIIDSYWFEFRLYATPLRNLSPREDFSNVCMRLPMIANQFFLDFYETFWLNDKWRVWYPSKPQVFDISKMLNSEEIPGGEIFPFDINNNSPVTSIWNQNNPNSKFEFIKVNYAPKLILNKKLTKEVDIFIDRINEPEKYAKLWLNYPKWLIFHWPAWTWKTSLARLIAAKTNKKSVFLEIMIDKIKWMYVWESEKAARQLFADMRKEAASWKVVIGFIDEIDWLVWSGEKKDDVDSGMRSVILSEMEWIIENKNQWIIFIWATNFLENISKAYVDRFDKPIEVDLPTEPERRELVDLFMFKHWEEIFEENLDYNLLISKTKETSHRFYKKWFENIVANYIYHWLNWKITTNDMISQIDITKSENWNDNKPIWFVH